MEQSFVSPSSSSPMSWASSAGVPRRRLATAQVLGHDLRRSKQRSLAKDTSGDSATDIDIPSGINNNNNTIIKPHFNEQNCILTPQFSRPTDGVVNDKPWETRRILTRPFLERLCPTPAAVLFAEALSWHCQCCPRDTIAGDNGNHEVCARAHRPPSSEPLLGEYKGASRSYGDITCRSLPATASVT